jgi:hypothetical protein
MRLHAAPRRFARILSTAATWSTTSQQQARRNALVASTALTARRAELEDVEEFFARRVATDRATSKEATRDTA